MKTPSRMLGAIAGTILFVVGCASLGTPEDQSTAGTLWKELDGYQAWSQFEGFEGIQKSKSSMHGKFVATYMNGTAAADPDALAPGSIVIKENFSKEDRSSLQGLTVMKRIAGYDPDNGDWFWARFEPSGKVTHSGMVAMCSDCHFDADGDDFVFLND